MSFLAELANLIGDANVLTGNAIDRFRRDWTSQYPSDPSAVVRPGSTEEVAGVMKIAARHRVPIVPVAGLTGLTGGSHTRGGLMLSVERLNRIRELRPETRIAIVEAGVVLTSLHEAASAKDLYFPLWFGARGSAMIGGVLSTNAGGSNVIRYGSARALCLGLEVVLADGRILDLMSELHKDNSGYDLRQLFIGAEGTLGVITAAVMKLVPRQSAFGTATVALRSLPDSLELLNRLQRISGGAVEAFEYMPESYMRRLAESRPDIRQPFSPLREVSILVEIGSAAPRDIILGEQGEAPLVEMMENTLAGMMEEGLVLDAEIAKNESQRLEMWQRRELAAEIGYDREPWIETDISLPLDKVSSFFAMIEGRLFPLDPGHDTLSVAHLGDGNVHFTVFPTHLDEGLHDAVVTAVEDVVQELGGSFSAEHGIGLMKLPSMARRKNKTALEVMRSIKSALDPDNLMNPGKVIPC